MIVGYLSRMVCLCLASFFVVHLASGVVVAVFAPAAIRIAERIRPRPAARFLLILRLLPLALAMLGVCGLCVPTYLWFEPKAAAERVGLVCLAVALLGAAIWGMSIAQAWRAVFRSRRYARLCRRAAQKLRLRGESSSAWVVEGASPCVTLVGVIRPRIFISRAVVSALSAEQLSAALRHERAHQISGDNFVRFLLLLAPDILPFVHGFVTLDRAWERFTERAADDRAVEGDPHRSLSLAAALVRVARLAAAPHECPLATSLLSDGLELSRRVNRLVHPPTPPRRSGRWLAAIAGTASLALSIVAMGLLRQPGALYSVHRLLECWMN